MWIKIQDTMINTDDILFVKKYIRERYENTEEYRLQIFFKGDKPGTEILFESKKDMDNEFNRIFACIADNKDLTDDQSQN